MSRRPIIALGLLSLAACSQAPQDAASGAEVAPDPSEAIIARAKVVVADELSDPDAARFRRVKALREEADQALGSLARWTVCGEVNGKNLMGGYVGYRPFRSHLYDDGDTVAVIRGSDLDDNQMFDANYKVGCEGADPSLIEAAAQGELQKSEEKLRATQEELRRLQGG